MISDAAFDRLKAIYGADRALWAAAYARKGVRRLARAHNINPDL